MAWSRRGKKRYYYISQRRGAKVVKTYCGGGLVGGLADRAFAARRQDRLALARSEQQLGQAIEQLRQSTREFTELARQLVAATLLVEGYHRHDRGPWRRRRYG